MATYNPYAWYWQDATGRIFSSAARAIVQSTDETYQAWRAAGSKPTPWPRDSAGAQTPDALDAVLAPYGLATGLAVPSLTQLQIMTCSLASQYCAAIVAQIMPDAAHQAAFQNAASLVNANAGAAPSSGPLASKFAALATVYGLSTVQFAALVVALQGASMDLSTALSTLNTAVAGAHSGTDIAAALGAFQSAMTSVMAEIAAANPPVTVVAPPAITIPGVNA